MGVSVKPFVTRSVLSGVLHKMGYSRATDEQESVIGGFVYGKDVFVSLPTGSGTMLCVLAALDTTLAVSRCIPLRNATLMIQLSA